MHAVNLEHFRTEYARRRTYLRRCRDLYGRAACSLLCASRPADDYCTAFGLPGLGLDPEQDGAEIDAYRAERIARTSTPEAQARRERERVKRRERMKRREARQRELQAASAAERVAAWRSGELYALSGAEQYAARSEGALLRIKGDTLQTSMGAEVPLAHAIRAFRLIKRVHERAEAWHRNGRTLRVGHFQLDLIHPNGDFRAGCHFIRWVEVERAAKSAGVFDEPSADTSEARR